MTIGRRDADLELDVREAERLPDDQRDQEQPGDQADAVPHVDARDADVSSNSNQLKNETIRKSDRRSEDELGSRRELLELVHFPPFPFGGVTDSLAFDRRM